MSTPAFIPILEKPGWSRAAVGGETEAIERLARTLSSTRPPNTFFVCGMLPDEAWHCLFRIETSDPLDIVKAFGVGAYAELSYGEDAHPAVVEQMSFVHAQNPIVPYFADPAGLKCYFEQPLSEDFLELLDATITEGIEIYADEGMIGPVVRREGYLHLWWD